MPEMPVDDGSRCTGRGWATRFALITDGRFSGGTRGFCHRSYRHGSRQGGPIALLRDTPMNPH